MMEAIVVVLNRILDLLKSAIEIFRRPNFGGGNTVKLRFNTQETVSFKVPASWADGWTVYVTPSNNYYALVAGKTGYGIKARISSSGGLLAFHNEAPRVFSPVSPFYTNPAINSDKWLNTSTAGEAFNVKGQEVFVDIRNEAGLIVIDPVTGLPDPIASTGVIADVSVEVMIRKGSPAYRNKTEKQIAVDFLLTNGFVIPRYAKAVKFCMTLPNQTISMIGDITFIDASGFQLKWITNAEILLLAERLTSDGAGGPVAVSKSTIFIDIPNSAMTIVFTNTNESEDEIMIEPTWRIYE